MCTSRLLISSLIISPQFQTAMACITTRMHLFIAMAAASALPDAQTLSMESVIAALGSVRLGHCPPSAPDWTLADLGCVDLSDLSDLGSSKNPYIYNHIYIYS